MLVPGIDDTPNCVDPHNLRWSECDPKLRKIECVLSLNDKMRRI